MSISGKENNHDRSSDKNQSPENNSKESVFVSNRYFSFVLFTFGFWLIIILITVNLDINLYFSTDIVKEMGSASLVLATIPFAILSILSTIHRDNDNTFKIALAGIAVVFLICGLGCFLILWQYENFETIKMSYTANITLGFIGAFFIQAGWFLFVKMGPYYFKPFNIFIQKFSKKGVDNDDEVTEKYIEYVYGSQAFLSTYSFVLSFLVVQVTAYQEMGGKLLFFVWSGFVGGLVSLIVLSFVALFSIPRRKNAHPIWKKVFYILVVSFIFTVLAAGFPSFLQSFSN